MIIISKNTINVNRYHYLHCGAIFFLSRIIGNVTHLHSWIFNNSRPPSQDLN